MSRDSVGVTSSSNLARVASGNTNSISRVTHAVTQLLRSVGGKDISVFIQHFLLLQARHSCSLHRAAHMYYWVAHLVADQLMLNIKFKVPSLVKLLITKRNPKFEVNTS